MDVPCKFHFFGNIVKNMKSLVSIQPNNNHKAAVEKQIESPCKKLKVESGIGMESASNGI